MEHIWLGLGTSRRLQIYVQTVWVVKIKKKKQMMTKMNESYTSAPLP